ncbi:salivary C-type lectin 2-like isoform X2 [Rhynchophorus ferrugineus]|uniref:salivary C-type lectin 2-like isoform X2 n=1 Tax=Rhynchophorus ferrugineus TaxID=354439 RepID=UPI003FCCF1EC
MNTIEIMLASIFVYAVTTSANKYVISNQKVTFQDGYLRCHQYGLDPAEVLSESDEIELEEALKSLKETSVDPFEGFWMFAIIYKSGNKTESFWLNSKLPLFYSKFSVGQPNGSGYNCLQIYRPNTGLFAWNDIPCDAKIRFICQRKQRGNMCSDE